MINHDPFSWVLAAFSIVSAIHHFNSSKALEKYAVFHGLVSADRSVKMTTLLFILIAAGFLIEETASYAGYTLGAFLLIAAFTVHKFWDVTDRNLKTSEMLHFTKNIFFAAAVVLYYL